ncbi:MAG: hypothetical protein WBE46_00490 [Dehalococcoidia bacterium]
MNWAVTRPPLQDCHASLAMTIVVCHCESRLVGTKQSRYKIVKERIPSRLEILQLPDLSGVEQNPKSQAPNPEHKHSAISGQLSVPLSAEK